MGKLRFDIAVLTKFLKEFVLLISSIAKLQLKSLGQRLHSTEAKQLQKQEYLKNTCQIKKSF
jgi:hypothetical protein